MEAPPTCDQVGMVAALAELHHGVDQVGHVVLAGSFRQEGEVLLQNGSVVLLLNVGQLHLVVHNINSPLVIRTIRCEWKTQVQTIW